MNSQLFAIISNAPERISRYVNELKIFEPRFLFFSDYASSLSKMIYLNASLLIVDNVDEKDGLVSYVKGLRQIDSIHKLTIIIITKNNGCDKGIMALAAGANDYVSYSLVNKELAARVNTYFLNKCETPILYEYTDVDIDAILPIEDKLIIKNSLIYINNNIDNLKGVYDLSFYLGKSERIINKTFVEHLGKTAFEYMRDFRVNKAQSLLGNTRMNINQIAEEVGYSSAANFSTAFRNVVGVSPRQYRYQKLAMGK